MSPCKSARAYLHVNNPDVSEESTTREAYKQMGGLHVPKWSSSFLTKLLSDNLDMVGQLAVKKNSKSLPAFTFIAKRSEEM